MMNTDKCTFFLFFRTGVTVVMFPGGGGQVPYPRMPSQGFAVYPPVTGGMMFPPGHQFPTQQMVYGQQMAAQVCLTRNLVTGTPDMLKS